MSAYIFIAIIIYLLSLLQNRRWLLWFTAILLFLVGGMRANTVGTDTNNYAELFYTYGDNLLHGHHATEPGYALLQMLLIKAGLSYSFFVFIVQVLIVTMITLYVSKTVYRPQYALLCYVLLYFYCNSFNISRQFLAIPFLLYAFYSMDEGDLKKYFLFLFCGFMFHYAAIVGLLALLFWKKRWSCRTQVCLLLFTFIVGATPLVEYLMRLLSSFLPESVSRYVIEADFGANFSFTRLLLTGMGVCLVFLLDNKRNHLSLLVLGICMLNILTFNSVLARISQFYLIIQIVIFPQIGYMLRPQYRKFRSLIEVCALCYMVVTYLYLLSHNVAGVVPYAIR